MSSPVELSRSCPWPRLVAMALIVFAVAGCSSDTSRFNEGPFSNPYAAKSGSDMTASTNPPAPMARVVSQPLPPAGYTTGALPPPPSSYATASSVPAPTSAPARMAASVPAANSMKTAEAGTHVVGPGESLSKIAHRYHVPLVEMAKANHIEPYAKIKMGDRLVVPGHAGALAQRPAPRAEPAQVLAEPKTPPAAPQKVASLEPTHTARVLTPATETPDADSGAKTADAATPGFRWPVRGRIIAGFGPKTNGQQNDGINLAVPEGTPVKAAEDGVVAYAGNELKGYGNLVLVRHANGFVTAYAHASELMVKRGDQIKRGQVIARSGQTGTVTSPQLHFEIRKGSAPVDPTQYLTGA